MTLNSNFKFQISNFKRGFTLVELVVTVAIIAVLSGIILFSVSQYISKGKDASVSGYLATLIPAGEVFYNGNGNSYVNFCDPTKNSVLNDIILEAPQNTSGPCYVPGNYPGGCCGATSQAWATCVREFTNPKLDFCADSRGVQKQICNSSCSMAITVCPDDNLGACQ